MTIDISPEARVLFDHSQDQTRQDAAPVFEFLSAAFRITWFRESGPRLYLAILKPKEPVASHFALDHEYFLVGHGFPADFHQRTLLAEPPREETYRLDSRIRFVASPAPTMRTACAAWAAQRRIAVIPIDVGPLLAAGSHDRVEALLKLLGQSLWRRDVFDDSEPITDPAEFFGRELPVQELLTRTTLGQPTAVFGLRKIGKSSLLKRVQQLLAGDPAMVVASAFIQCNAARFRSGRWWNVLQEVQSQWLTALAGCAKASGSSVQPAAKKLSQLLRDGAVPEDSKVGEAFERDFDKLLRAGRQIAADSRGRGVRFVAIFDEVDSVYPKGSAPDYWTSDYFTLWDSLQSLKRGLDDPSELVYVLGGVNPAPVERGSLMGRPNPLFELGVSFLRPLPLSESRALLTGLGSRAGLAFDVSAQERIHAVTGGHPWLLRKLGSKIHLTYNDRGAIRAITAEDVDRVFQRTKRAFYAHIDWILDHLKQVAPDEHRLLIDIAVGGRDKYLVEWAEESFRDVFAEHLSRYGLLRFDGEVPELEIGLIREAVTQPAASTFPEQKKQLREAVDQLESAIRNRLSLDLARDRSLVTCNG